MKRSSTLLQTLLRPSTLYRSNFFNHLSLYSYRTRMYSASLNIQSEHLWSSPLPNPNTVTLNDGIANQIINSENTIESLLEIRTRNYNHLTTLHNVLLFNKISNLFYKEQEELKKDKLNYDRVERTIEKLQMHLLENKNELSPY
jgi:hypothetical protein